MTRPIGLARHIPCFFIVILGAAVSTGMAQSPATRPATRSSAKSDPEPAYAPITDDPKLPRVMLIGDSISVGYTLPVRSLLAGKANVHRPPTNCFETARGLAGMDGWLGTGKWDVIHFNFGLHDLKYLDANGKYVNPSKGKQVAPPEVYEQNLRQLVARLKKTGAKLIWASTTPVPAHTGGRVEGDEVRYNAVAAKVMGEEQIPIDDLHAIVIIDGSPTTHPANGATQLPRNVHFTAEGYERLAESVAASIDAALAK